MSKMSDEFLRQQEVCADLIGQLIGGDITENDVHKELKSEGITKDFFDREYKQHDKSRRPKWADNEFVVRGLTEWIMNGKGGNG